MTETINITPSWKQTARMLIVLLENGTEESKAYAREELERMAETADKHVAATVEAA